MNNFKIIYKMLSNELKFKFKFLFCASFFSVIVETLSVGIIIPILGILDSNENLVTEFIKSNFNVESKLEMLNIILIFCLIFFTLKIIFNIILSKIQGDFVYGTQKELSLITFNSFLNKDYIFHKKTNSSEISKIIYSDINLMSDNYFMSLVSIFSEILIFIGLASMLIFIEPIGFFVILSFYAVSLSSFFVIMRKKVNNIGRKRGNEDKLKFKATSETFENIKDIIIYDARNFFLDFYKKPNETSASYASLKYLYESIPRFFLEIMTFFGLMALIYLLYFYRNYEFSYIVVVMGVFAASAFRVLPSLSRVVKNYQKLKYIIPLVDDLLIFVKEDSKENTLKSYSFMNDNPFEIVAKNISFGYEKNINIINDLSLKISTNQITGFFASSGKGKTTLIDLLIGLYPVNSGTIIINGVNINDYSTDLHKYVGYVTQQPILYDDSVAQNILFGAELSQNRLKNCIKKANVSINNFEYKKLVDYKVGERGVNVSGGQKQRIAIARALYREPKILILDEATSGLDEETENKIFSDIKKLKKDMLVIVISHSNNVKSYCDNIINL